MSKHALRIIPLGGLGEVGKNMMVYEYGREAIIVDTGLMFPENDMLGVDYIIPDMHYLKDKTDWVKGIVITHGHEDHIGAIQHVLDLVQAPVYATALTRGLIEAKLARNGGLNKAELNTVHAGETIKLGPFHVEFIHVSHSVPDGVALGIQTPAGLLVHTADFKFDQTPVDNWPTDFARLASLSEKGVLALLSDSTNSVRASWTPSERVIDGALDEIFSEAQGRIIVASFASLISRMQQVANAARNHGRKIAFAGTSMVDNVKIASKLGYLEIPDTLQVPLDQALKMPDKDVVIMCTGSQGEPGSILGRLSTDRYYQFDIQEGDTVILSSHPIPGNEETVFRTINRLFRRGANVFYEEIAPVHVSGHASQEELKMMINLVKPKYLIPIHGELRHLRQHAEIGRRVGIPLENIFVIENGQVLEIEDGQARLGERVPGTYVFVEGAGVQEISTDVMRERENLSQSGLVLVNLTLNEQNGKLRRQPEITTYGFILKPDNTLPELIASNLSRANGNLQQSLQKTIQSYLYEETRRRPLVFVNVNRV
jgi:ribonuclease J